MTDLLLVPGIPLREASRIRAGRELFAQLNCI